MKWSRASGVLAHPTSLPGPFGIGDLGPATMRLLDFLAAGKQRLWQTLPLCPTGYGDSPYAGLSAFAGNPLLISPELLVDDGLLDAAALREAPGFALERVEYGEVGPWKMGLLRQAYGRFVGGQGAGDLRGEYERFREAQRAWLDDFALFAALKNAHNGVAWVEWEPEVARREPEALAVARRDLGEQVEMERFVQFLFFRQWDAVRAAAHARDIAIVGDVAIFVAHDSADVWAHPELFLLDERGQPTVVAGVPPDYFSPTGQRWGNPLYRWETLEATGYGWWVERIRHALTLDDVIRLDHFRGFESYWEVAGAAETAIDGRWVQAPGMALFEAIRGALGEAPFIAEDLGQITPEVDALREHVGAPGMRVLQFAFGDDARNQHLPHMYRADCVVYTGTHDNDTTRGWFEARGEGEREYTLRYLACEAEEVVWAMIRAAEASVADTAIIPLQDLLDLGSEARMNFPSRADGNWAWRCTEGQLSEAVSARLGGMVETYGRG